MGDRTCYVAFCEECERAVPSMTGTCPDCGSTVEY